MSRPGYKGPCYKVKIKWDIPTISRFRASYDRGGFQAIVQDFPKLRHTQIKSAISRYVTTRSEGPPVHIDREDIRRRIREMPYDQFMEGVVRVTQRCALRDDSTILRPMKEAS